MPSTGATIAIDRILATAAQYGASDCHLSPGTPPILRVDGRLVALEGESIVTPDFVAEVAQDLLTPDQRQRLERDRQVVGTIARANKARYKTSFFYERDVLAVALRFLSPKLRTLKDLGLPPVVQTFAQLERGLVLITGPFGSGRTTTAGALIEEINRTRSEHIVTIEQPIEFLFGNVQSVIEQREVGRDAVSFEQALEAAAREDVDVIFVSDMDSPSVIQAVLDAAESSRLVISTMNTDSVLQTIEKMVTSFPEDEVRRVRVQLAGTLQGIVSQRLLPRVGGGRVAVAEVLVPTPPIRSVIRDGQIAQLANIVATARGEAGTTSLDRALAELVKTGEVQVDEALAHALDRDALRELVRA